MVQQTVQHAKTCEPPVNPLQDHRLFCSSELQGCFTRVRTVQNWASHTLEHAGLCSFNQQGPSSTIGIRQSPSSLQPAQSTAL